MTIYESGTRGEHRRAVATYENANDGLRAVHALLDAGVTDSLIETQRPDDRIRAKEAFEGAEPIEATESAPGMPMLRAAFPASAVGAVIGAAILAVAGAFIAPVGSLSGWASVLVIALCGAAAGWTIGFVAMGGREPRIMDELRDDNPMMSVSVVMDAAEMSLTEEQVVEMLRPEAQVLEIVNP